MEAAKAKVQERTPVFTIIQGAAVPVKPAGPKRMIFVAFVLLLTFAGTSLYILRRQ
jgi:LPS O-antigen subunit length determinant protein (WzzB/FepE family)